MSEITIERATAASAPKVRTGLSRRTRLLSVLALAAGLAAAGYGYRWWSVDRWLETTDDAYVGGDVTPISPHVAGFISAILVRDNQPVRAGELLVKLDDRDFAAALDQAAALLRGRQATLDGLRAKDGLQAAVIRQAEADLAAKKAQALFAHEDAIRYGNLARTSAGSQQNAQKSAAADEEAQAAVIASQAALDGARQQLAVLAAAITEAEATVAQAEADVKTARLNLGYTEIRSPIDGRVGLAIFTVGNLVQPSSGRLATIVSQDPIYVTFPASERDVIAYRHRLAESGGINQHLPVHIKLPDGTIYGHPGLTNFLDVQVETNTDTVIVRAEFPNPDGLLVPGGIVGVGVDTGPPKWALLVP